MEISKLIASFLFLISLLKLVSNPSSQAALIPNDVARNQIGGYKSTVSDPKRVDPKRDCGEMGSRSECSLHPECRWCRSEALDDTCFSKSEAWRLPSQVFSCEF